MHSIHRARYEQRLVASIGAAMLSVVGCSVGVLAEADRSAQPDPATPSPFWSNEPSASNLAVVELYRSGNSETRAPNAP